MSEPVSWATPAHGESNRTRLAVEVVFETGSRSVRRRPETAPRRTPNRPRRGSRRTLRRRRATRSTCRTAPVSHWAAHRSTRSPTMAVLVVDPLEVIDIDQGERHRRVRPTRGLGHSDDGPIEPTAIGDPGQVQRRSSSASTRCASSAWTCSVSADTVCWSRCSLWGDGLLQAGWPPRSAASSVADVIELRRWRGIDRWSSGSACRTPWSRRPAGWPFRAGYRSWRSVRTRDRGSSDAIVSGTARTRGLS